MKAALWVWQNTKSDPCGCHQWHGEFSPIVSRGTFQYNGGSYRVFASGCGEDWCVYLRPVWLCTWSGSQEEQQAPSGSYSCRLSRKTQGCCLFMGWFSLLHVIKVSKCSSYIIQLLETFTVINVSNLNDRKITMITHSASYKCLKSLLRET